MLRNGDLIKSFEFEPIPGREDKYVIGAIDHIEEHYYVIKGETIIKDTVYGNSRMNENVTVRVPKKIRLDFDGRIVALTEDWCFTEKYYEEFHQPVKVGEINPVVNQ